MRLPTRGLRQWLARFMLTAVLCGLQAANAATYYVDQVAGNDDNTGTSTNLPWKNAPGMSAYAGRGVLYPGDKIYFNSSGIWSVNGTQGIYLTGGVTYIGNGWGTGTRAVLRATSDIASAVVRFKDDPTTPTVFQGFDVDANGKVANGIEMNHSFYAGPLIGATKRVDNVVVRNVWSRASLGQYRYGVILSNWGGASGEVANVEILNSVIHDISRDGLVAYPSDQNAQCIVRNVIFRGNTVYNTGKDPDYGAGAGIIVKGRVIDIAVENNFVTSTKGAGIFINGNETNHFGYGPTNVHIRNNIINTNTVHGSIRVYDGSGGGDPKDLHIYGNIFANNSSGGGLVIESDVRNSNSLRIYNNTFYNAPIVINNSIATFPVFEFRNNLVHQTSGVPFTDNQKRLTAHSNNLFSGSGTLVRAGGVSFTASTLSAYDPTALYGDPGFVDPASIPTGFLGAFNSTMAPNAAGLSLQPSSRAIDRGALLPSPYNSSINSLRRPQGLSPDIGAYESGSTSLPPPTSLRVQ